MTWVVSRHHATMRLIFALFSEMLDKLTWNWHTFKSPSEWIIITLSGYPLTFAVVPPSGQNVILSITNTCSNLPISLNWTFLSCICRVVCQVLISISEVRHQGSPVWRENRGYLCISEDGVSSEMLKCLLLWTSGPCGNNQAGESEWETLISCCLDTFEQTSSPVASVKLLSKLLRLQLAAPRCECL